MPARKYTRSDGATGEYCGSIAVTVWSDGTYTGNISSWVPGGERLRCQLLPAASADATLAPPLLSALADAARRGIELWFEGRLD